MQIQILNFYQDSIKITKDFDKWKIIKLQITFLEI